MGHWPLLEVLEQMPAMQYRDMFRKLRWWQNILGEGRGHVLNIITSMIEYLLSNYVRNSCDSTDCIALIEVRFTTLNDIKYLILGHA